MPDFSVMSRYLLLCAAVLISGHASAREFECLLEPHVEVNVSSPVPGLLAEVLVERGDEVQLGETIARLKSEVELANVALARARAEYGQRKITRNEEMIQQSLISPSEMDELETENKVAQLELEQVEAALRQRTIVSPIQGVVVERFLSAGEFVQDDPILKLAQLHPLNVEVILPVEELGRIRVGIQAQVRTESMVKGSFPATVVIVDSVIDAASGTIGVRLELPNPDHRIPAGLKCTVSFPDR